MSEKESKNIYKFIKIKKFNYNIDINRQKNNLIKIFNYDINKYPEPGTIEDVLKKENNTPTINIGLGKINLKNILIKYNILEEILLHILDNIN